MTRSVGRAIRLASAVGIIGMIAAMAPQQAVLGAPARSVELTLLAGKNAGDGGFDFNGYQRGAMTVTVPTGWRIVVHFENTSALPHSLAVLPFSANQPAAPRSAPAFAGAATKNLAGGLPQGAKQTFTFDASKPGTYEFACGVPGHAAAGMWDKLVVSPTAKSPVLTPAGAATIVVK